MTARKKHSKDGAALVLALGFLAVLVVLIIAFSARARVERVAGRAYLSDAQAAHLVQAALASASSEIDAAFGTNQPNALAFGSPGADSALPLNDGVDFSLLEDYLPRGNSAIMAAYDSALREANWEPILGPNGQAIGRLGYVVVNTSGLLDANHVGGVDAEGAPLSRESGASPREIRLDRTLLSELRANTSIVLANGTTQAADPASAFARNRDTAWRRYESLRDLRTLNEGRNRGNAVNNQIAHFNTFSHTLPGLDERVFMGTNLATLASAEIEAALTDNEAIDAPFVMNQLRDYLDLDTTPEDENGDYTDLSVEPVPLINELALICGFTFEPEWEINDDNEIEVTSVTISNQYHIELEAWYPFVGIEQADLFSVSLTETPEQSAELPVDLFSNITEWVGGFDLPSDAVAAGADPFNARIHEGLVGTTVSSEDDMITLFEEIASDVEFPAITCTNATTGELVDRVLRLELPMEFATQDELLPEITALARLFFASNSTLNASNTFTVSMSCVDPRLNWDGASTNQWLADASAGLGESAGSLGEINQAFLVETSTPDDLSDPKIFVRNEDRIDTPWEFTYFLYDPDNPWKTLQMLAANDADDTRFILNTLSPHPNGPPTSGRVNPFSPHTNVIASVFNDMPVAEFRGENNSSRLGRTQACQAAEYFMDLVQSKNEWPDDAADYALGADLDALADLIGETDPWALEGFFRNSRELFNPRDTHYTIFLAARSGVDANEDGEIGDEEVRGARDAVVHLWRDPVTQKSAVVFFGLSDTLESSIRTGGRTWSDLLRAFEPDD